MLDVPLLLLFRVFGVFRGPISSLSYLSGFFVAFVTFCKTLFSFPLRASVVACLLLSASLASAADLVRVVEPVRLAPERGETLAGEVARTRETLEKFAKAGYERAVWVVEKLPAADTNIVPWTAECLKAFPAQPILALDLEPTTDAARMRTFLIQALPGVQAVVVNWDRHNMETDKADPAVGAQPVLTVAKLVRELSPKMFIWVRVEDQADYLSGLEPWLKALSDVADGWWLNRWHEWNVGNEHAGAADSSSSLSSLPSVKLLSSLSSSGTHAAKPVMRGGFRYSATRPRPALKAEMAGNYSQRLPAYEKWLTANGFAGFSRVLGSAIPAKLEPTLIYTGE